MDFTRSNGHRIAEFRTIVVHGLKSLGSFTLILPVEIDLFPVPNPPFPYIQELVCHLYVKARHGTFFLGEMFSFSGPKRFQASTHVHKQQHDFALKLSQIEIDKIELLRAGEGLEFEYRLFGIMFEGEYVREGQRHSSVSLNQSAWLKILEGWEYSKVLTFEIPTRGVTSNEKLSDAFLRLEEAQKAFNRGEWRQSVALCRDSLEVVKNYGDDLNHKTANSKQERYQLVQKFLHFTHLAKHYDSNEARTASWKREDALFILTSSAALIHKLSLNPEEA